jgi:hypothetical protein
LSPRRRVRLPLVPIVLGGALVATTAAPLAGSMRIMATHITDAGHLGYMRTAEVTALSNFLRRHQGSARYEVASAAVAGATPLIVRDARPVLMLTSWQGRPLLTPAELARDVRAGRVHYALFVPRCPARSKRCAPVLRWAAAHSRDIGRQAGVPRRVLYQLT